MCRRFCHCTRLFLLLFLLIPPAWGVDDSSLWSEALTNIDLGELTQATALLNQGDYDDYSPSLYLPCSVDDDHYLMEGVGWLWDAKTDVLVEVTGEPIAFLNENNYLPWIVEEDTDDAGSVVLIHDSSLMNGYYMEIGADPPYANRKFMVNLCTVFHQ